MKYAAILNAFYNEPLAILPEKLEAIRAFLLTKSAGDDISPEEIASIKASRRQGHMHFLAFDDGEAGNIAAITAARRPDGILMAGNVAVLQVFGVLSQRVGMVGEASGGVSAEKVGSQLEQLAGEKSVRSIVMAFDSPGGSVYGIQELGEKIRSLREQKKIVGLADSVAASAAYWLLSQTSEINVTPGGQVGSIGVVSAHEDHSAKLERDGVKPTLITAGKYKAEGNPFGPLNDEARAEIQAKVDHYYTQFLGAVAKGRGVTEARVEKDFGQGRMVTSKEAVERGMADRVATIAQVLRRLGADDGGNMSTANARARMVQG